MEPTFTRLARLFVSLLFLCSLGLYSQIGPGIASVNLPSGGFTIDGSLLSNSTNGDWVDGTGSGGFVLANSGTPLNTKTTYHLYDEYNSGTDDIFGGGDKVSDNPNSMSWVMGTSNNKTDMNNALIHFTTDANGNVWFVFAADRLSNSGNAYIDFEFLQDGLTKTATGFSTTASNVTGGRTEGDFLLTVYFESGVAKFDIQRWTLVSGVWQYKTYYSSLPANSVYAAGNSTTITVPYSAFGTNSYPQNTFIESAVNLTEVLGAIDPCASLKIKTIFVKSKTSTAPSASIKDFFEPLAVSNLTLGSADAGDDDSVCAGGSYKLQGTAVPSSNYSVVSTTWSVISGSATISNPSQLDSYVTINGGTATLRLTVETHSGTGTHCIVYDDVIITSTPSPSCLITGTDGPICLSTESSFSAPSSTSYLWSISGNGTISGSTTSQTVSVTTGSTCNQSFILSLTTTDANGCTSTCTKTAIVNDANPPVVTTSSGALDHNIQCDNTAAIASALTEVPTATDNCSTTPTMHLVSDVTTADSNCANGYSRVRTWNFTDGCGNTSSNFVQTITVIDTTAPVVTTSSGTLDHSIQCSDTAAIASALTEVPTATDNCSTTPTIHLVSDVTTADSNCANGYSRVRTWNFTDGCGNTSSNFVQTITVIDTTAPVVTTSSGTLDHSIQCSDTAAIASALTEVPTATDNCSTTPTMHLVSDVTTPDSNCANTYSRVRTWNFTDGCGNTSADFVQTITVIDNTAPVVTTSSGTLDHSIQCDNTAAIASALTEVPTATDNCSTTPTMHLVSDVTTADSNCTNGYSRVRTWNFTDGCGNTSANFVQTITIIDTTAPVVTTTSGALDHSIQCSNTAAIASALTEVPTATDNCSTTPTMHLVSDVTTPNSNCANGYSRVRTWNFTDGCGNTSADFVQTITVIDTTAPVVTTSSGALDHSIQCDNTAAIASALTEVPTATDNCSATPTIHLVSDVTTADSNCANGYSRVRTWNFTDACGNTSSNFVQTITVIDTTAPIITTTSGTLDHNIQCDNTAAIASALTEVPTANDNCSATPTIHLVSDVTTADSNCANGYSRVRTWNFTDGCGNTSSNFVQTITIIDTTTPTWTTVTGSLNSTIECSDTKALANAQNLFPIATDNCDTNLNNIIKVAGTFVASATCANAGTYTNTWTVTDDCGNTSEIFTQTITIQDTTAPTFIAPADITLSSGTNCYADISTVTTGEVTGIQDNCDPNPTASFTDSDCFGNFDAASVNSGTGNYFPITISGFDNVSANAIKKLALSFETNQGKGSAEFVLVAPNGQGVVLVAPYCNGGDCNNPTPNQKEVYLTEFYPASSNFPKWDNNNLIATNSIQNFTPNGALSTSNSITGLNSLVSSFEEFTGNLNGNWFIFARKDGTQIGEIKFNSACLTPGSNSCANDKVIFRKWTVNDACANAVSFNQIIKIVDTTAPTWATLAGSLDSTIECSDAQALANAQKLFPVATDNCDADLSKIVKVTGTFVASATCSNAGTYTNTWTVTDDCGNVSETFTQVINVIDNTAPTWTTAVGNLNTTVECSDTQALVDAQNLFPIASDNCDADLSNIVKVAGTFVASATCANAGIYTNTWTVTDDCGNVSETFTQIITIKDTTDPILLTQATDKIVECDGQGNKEAIANWLATNGGATASDNCSEIHWSNNFESFPKDCSSKITVKFTATDDCGNKTSTSATFSVQDTTPPVVPEAPTNITVKCSSDIPPMISLTAKDNCSGDLTDEGTNNIKKGDCKNSYEITRTWTFRDDCNNIATTSQTIIVEDNIAPVITSLPEPTTISCAGTPQFAQPTATDECGYNKVNLAFNDVKTEGNCAGSYSITRTWTATDACGNSSTASQTIVIEDKTAPVIANLPLPTTISCPNTPVFAFATATDECGSDFSLTFNDVRTEGSCVGSYSITRTWTATDTCGNSSTASQTITVEDKTAPVIANLPAPTTINYPNTPEFVQATATDECSPELSLTFKDVRTDGNTINSYSITRTWTAIDACGNSSTASQTINVENKTGPITTSEFNAEIVATCDAIPAKPELVFTSPCPTVTPAVFTETISNQTANSYTINRKWVATDICGNTSEFIQTVNITISNALTMVTGTVCNDGESTSIDLASLLPIGTPTNGTWTDVSNTGKLGDNNFNAATLAVGDYIFEYTINDTNCPRSIRITVTVTTGCGGIVLPCGTIVVHNAFSPNGDGINEKFVIDNINDTNCYPDNTVEIYNRWGVLVYSTKGYNNTTNAFDGISDGRSTVSQSSGLPAGTYFYILTYTSFDNNNVIQNNKKVGYLFLTK